MTLRPTTEEFKKLAGNLKHQDHSRLSKNEVTKLRIIKLRTEKSSDWSNANSLKPLIRRIHK